MDFKELSLKDQALVEAFAEIAVAECGERSWDEVEPLLASCWNKSHRKASALDWQEIAPCIRAACEKSY